jgi:outer membrane protein assembly factor BamB
MIPAMLARPCTSRFLLSLGVALLACGLSAAGDWPRFRGPNGTGIASDKDVPVKWTASNVLWKTPLPGIGHSSPIVHGGRVFLQSASVDGQSRSLLALDAATGEVLWKTPSPGKRARTHDRNSLASSTPATDGERVYSAHWDGKNIHLGAYDFKTGKAIWENDLGAFRSQHGFGHSPMLIDGKVILANDQDGSANLLAFDARTGAKAWQTPRRAFRSCYSTPLIHVRPDGDKELIVASTAGIAAYNPADGKANWWYTWSFSGMALRTVGSPIVAGDVVLATSGDGSGDRHTIAVKLGDKGEVTADHLAWENRQKYPLPYVPCLLTRGEYVYSVHDKGLASCHAVRSGEEVWSERLSTVGFTASPILVDGKVYAAAENGEVFVYEASPKFELLAKNALGEPVYATPAVANNHLFLRGNKHLYCIGKPAVRGASRTNAKESER